jgi:hypothetical protein
MNSIVIYLIYLIYLFLVFWFSFFRFGGWGRLDAFENWRNGMADGGGGWMLLKMSCNFIFWRNETGGWWGRLNAFENWRNAFLDYCFSVLL